MAAKQRRINLGRVSSDDVLLALGAPFSILDVIADLQFNGVGARGQLPARCTKIGLLSVYPCKTRWMNTRV